MTNDNCDGCCCYMPEGDPHDVGCTHCSSNNRGECPCTTCIVKVMCTEPCEDYSYFRGAAVKITENK